MKNIKIKPTNRGFSIGVFKDGNDADCSIQISSAIRSERLIWLGADDINLRTFVPFVGWKTFTDDELRSVFNADSILANTRMHLTQSQVKALLPLLTRFAETGDFL